MAEWVPLQQIASVPLHARTVARCGAAELRHAEFRAHIACWRDAFQARRGHKVALYFDDTAAFAAALFGAWHAGKQVLLCADTLPQTLHWLDATVDGVAGDFPVECGPITPAPGNDAAPATAHWPALDALTTRVQVLTSGSTGAPVAIDKTLAQLAREVEALEACFGAQLGDAAVHGTVSHQHIYGLLFRVLWPLAAGRAIAPRVHFHEDLAASVQGPAILVSSPALLKRIPAGIDWAQAQRGLRAVFSSGGALPPEAAQAARACLGLAPIEIFGSSETGGIAWRQSAQTPPSAWQPLPGVAWRVVDAQLEVASPHLPTRDWWRTSDRVQADAAGGFVLLGRADRIVKVEEQRVSLTALEQQLQALPAVVEARVLLLDGARAQLAAVLCLTPEGVHALQATGRRTFIQHLNAALASSQGAVTRPRRWRFVDAMPADAQGKATDAALRALFRPARPQPIWVRREPALAQLEFELDPQLLVFDGHFPQLPILPGVAQLDWAVRHAREAFALPPGFLRLEALKFQQVARPGLRLCLQLEWLAETATLRFAYHSALGPHASGRVVFAEAAP